MKHTFAYILAALALVRLTAGAAEYTLKGERWLRLYTADRATPVYTAQIDAQRVVNNFCNVAWTKSDISSATFTFHDSNILDTNVAERASFDAALFCAKHVNATHVAYANAACYRIDLGTGTLPKLTSLAVNVYSDPYNSQGARIVLLTNDSGVIPTDCKTVRGEVDGGIKATNVARRVTVTTGGKDYWYPASTNLVFSAEQLGADGLQLCRYLYVFVLLENYATTRGDWLEGSAYIDNAIKLTTDAALPGYGDSCDIAEPYATAYHLKDGEAGNDADGDGLSNYAEYLITEVFKFAELSPDNAKSDGSTPDYFRKVGDVYLGEIFTDDAHKTKISSASNSLIRAVIRYNGRKAVSTFTIKAWKDADMLTQPDAEWIVRTSDAVSTERNAWTFMLNGTGKLSEGSNHFVVFAGDSSYSAGTPYGFVRDIDVGRYSASFEVELTDTSAVFARIEPSSGSNDRETIFGNGVGILTTNMYDSTPTYGKSTHIRIVPYSLTCYAFDHGSGSEDPFVSLISYGIKPRVVAEFDIDSSTHPFVSEADFIRDGQYDIDWEGFSTTKMAQHAALVNLNVQDITAVRYQIVIGAEGACGLSSENDSSTPVSACHQLIERRFESWSSRTIPSDLNLEGGTILYGAWPTFTWRLDEPTTVDEQVRGSGYFGCTYTAFAIQVLDYDTDTVVYDSGVVRTPARDSNGTFRWTPPLAADSQTSLGKIFAKVGRWKWQVAMYNAKFQPSAGGWSETSNFETAVGQQQETDDHGYGSVKVAVKYAGPVSVLKYVSDTTDVNGKVRLQAFATPDFSGAALAETIVTDKPALTNTLDVTANATLCGLAAGTYYIRAYIDSDGDFEKDVWESWGEAKSSVTIAANKPAETVAVWIEDADTDGDWIPDAYESVTRGYSIGAAAMKIDPDGEIILKTTTYNSVTNGTANISTTLSGASLTFFENLDAAARLLGIDSESTTNTISAIRAAVEKNIKEQ